jgi:integrase
MYLLVQPSGAKYWRLKYRFAGKEKLLGLGVYDVVSLAEARQRRAKAKVALASGSDPSLERQVEKRKQKIAAANTLEAIAEEWHENNKHSWSDDYADWILRALKADIFPWLGRRPIAEIEPPDVLQALRRIESRNALVTAHRVRNNLEQIFAYAIASGRATRNPATDLRRALKALPEKKHHASVKDPKSVGELLRAIDGYQGSFVTRCALRLAPLVFVRPGELRKAEWREFELDAAEWRIPAERMKMGAPHIVPLSTQAVALLRELHPLTGPGKYVFPSIRDRKNPMSENTINAALRRLNYGSDQMTAHGFRSMASTLLNEAGWNRDAIERQLAHGERDKVRAAYNAAEHLPERRRMMQAWADFLDGLTAGGAVTPIRHAA